MKISARGLGELLAECFNAISPDTNTADAARWKGRLSELIGRALRRDPDDVIWALEGCDTVPLPGNAEEVVQGYGAPSEDDCAAAIEMFRWYSEPDRGRYDYMENIDVIPVVTDVDYELVNDRVHELSWQDKECSDEWAREYDIDGHAFGIVEDEPKPNGNDSTDSEVAQASVVERPAGLHPLMEWSPPVAISATPKASEAPSLLAPKTEGFLCVVPELDRASLKEIRKRASWVESAKHDSDENGGRVDIVSIFADGAKNESYSGYEVLVKPHRKLGCCFEEVIEIERRQDSIPMLKSLPEGIVIDFPGIRPRGEKGEYGILRMKRGKDGRWKAGFEWIAVTDAHKRMDIFSDKVRIAVFVRPEGKK